MTEADLADIATLEISASRGPDGWIEWNRRNYTEHGFGVWVIETHDGEFVGDCGLTMQEVEGKWLVEAGWHVGSALRRQGYAAEAAAAVRAKIGLVLEREIHKNGGPALVFGADLHPSHTRR